MSSATGFGPCSKASREVKKMQAEQKLECRIEIGPVFAGMQLLLHSEFFILT
jgi:hypothetical protein